MKIIEMFDPRGEDERLSYFLKTISLIVIFGIIISPFIFFREEIPRNYKIIPNIIINIIYPFIQSFLVIRRVKNLGGNIVSNLIFYNLYPIISIIGFILKFLGIEGIFIDFMAYGGGSTYLIKLILDVIYSTIKKDKKDFCLLNPKGTDGRLEYFLKSLFVFLIELPLFIVLFYPFMLEIVDGNTEKVVYMILTLMGIHLLLIQILQSLNVARRVRDIGLNIKKHLILYNIGVCLVIIGYCIFFSGNIILASPIIIIGFIFTFVRFILDIVYLLKRGEKEGNINDEKEKIENNETVEIDKNDEEIEDEEMNVPEWILLIMIIGVIVIGVGYFLIMK